MKVVAITVLAWSILGCSGAEDARVFSTALPRELDPPLPVVLHDGTGLVTAIGPADDPQGDQVVPTVLPDLADPKAFVVTWLGDPCEQDVALYFSAQGGDYVLDLSASHTGSCPLIGYPRGVRIETSTPIPINSIKVNHNG